MKKNVQKPGLARTSSTRKISAYRTHLGLIAIAVGVTGSALAATVPKEAPKVLLLVKHSHSHTQVGKASWYGAKFNGRRTASGERFNMNALTCAHRSLPLGSWVRVTNMGNQKSVFLRVNDRGPVPASRVMDLSYAAARKLGLVGAGLGRVRIEPVQSNNLELAAAMLPEIQSMPLLQLASTPAGAPVLPRLIADR
ncbi:MAG: septal ring lytic transglycosylase RlpA family protein [Acidobacteriaceae bacterium]